MFDNIDSVPALNAARHTRDTLLTASLNNGMITDAQWQTRASAIADAYEARIHIIWAVQQTQLDNHTIAAAERLGFTVAQFSTATAVKETMAAYSAKTLAGFPVKETPEGDAAIARLNRVSVALTDANDAYQRIHKSGGS